jgi:hypothetical protein
VDLDLPLLGMTDALPSVLLEQHWEAFDRMGFLDLGPLHIPKTGGTWVTLALQVAGVPCEIVWTRLGPGSRGHATLAETRAYSDRFSFAFVRHPLDLYRSRWAANENDGWPMNRFLHGARSDDFTGSSSWS